MLIQKGLGYSLNTPPPPLLATKHNSVAIVYISYKNFRYSLDKSAVKIDRIYCFLTPLLRFAISSSSFPFFLTLQENLSVVYTKSMKKTTSCKMVTESLGWTSSSANQRHGIRTLLSSSAPSKGSSAPIKLIISLARKYRIVPGLAANGPLRVSYR